MRKCRRKFLPGDEWIYYKVYLGVNFSDEFLYNVIRPLARKLLKEKDIAKWFFIRYMDPDYHIRIRFHLTGQEKTGKIINLFNGAIRKYIDDKLIIRVEISTYEREVERYGDTSIAIAEELFYSDSLILIDIIGLQLTKRIVVDRWLIALRLTDAFLNDMRVSYSQRLVIMSGLYGNFALEFGVSKPKEFQFNTVYAKYKEKIKDYLERTISTDPVEQKIIERSRISSGVTESLLRLRDQKELKPPFFALLSDFIHMTINRLFVIRQREYEIFIYLALMKYYTSTIKRVS